MSKISAGTASATGLIMTADITGDLELQSSGVTKIKVKANGQLESVLATGTAPLIVASTTLNANLNAELLGGTNLVDLKRWSKENSKPVGEMVNTEVPLTPVIWGGNPDTYLPVIKRWDADHDVTSTQAPDLVTAYRAATASINVAGAAIASWTGTVSGSTITFASNAANLALLNLLVNEATANGYIQTQTAGAAALFTGTAQRCINVAGTDYAITAASVGGLTVTVSGTPTSGSQTCILYPYRIAGSTTSVRLPRLSGFVGVAQYDYDGNFVAGFRKMDQMQGHTHGFGYNVGTSGATGLVIGGSNSNLGSSAVGNPSPDGTNGTLRTGKTTDSRTYALYPHTWACRLLA